MVLEEMMLILAAAVAAAVLGGLGLVMCGTDLGTGMFCTCRDGYIWTARGKKLLPDTPENRRRVSRRLGCFFLVLPCVVLAAVLVYLWTQTRPA